MLRLAMSNISIYAAARIFIVNIWSGNFLAVAMVSVGLGTDLKKLKNMGSRPFFVGLFAAIAVGIVSFALIKLFIPDLG